ncbi:hypothetical protein BOW86_gp120 [Synechococcus phage S-CAM7]|uniref:Uncharacterized protein n=1 Tax=Synechococcus phage S-CAM7 TaxID=1883368 RepID=A0A1D8KTZ8_9CAUD|nr:hypothetical protein BOW86_gp120 [Synechococcus phage S-CAM7]AOV62044.1 hypothetical protein C490910_120 [Synechococcus phage S-CAM7]
MDPRVGSELPQNTQCPPELSLYYTTLLKYSPIKKSPRYSIPLGDDYYYLDNIRLSLCNPSTQKYCVYLQ